MKGDGHINKKTRWHRSLLLCTVVLSSVLSGCGLLQKVGLLSGPPVVPPAAIDIPVPLAEQPSQLMLTLSAASDVNPDSQLRPSPIQVRIFVTDSQSEIASQGFDAVFDIGGTLIEPRPLATVTLRPGQVKELVLPTNKSQTRLAIAAAYRDPFQSIWITTTPITAQDTVRASATLAAQSVTINSNP